MKRTKPLRRTPMTRRPQGGGPRHVASTMPDRETTTLLIARAQGRCEICNLDLTTGRDWSRHHRIPRGRGGTNTLSNLLLLCGTGTTGCHGVIESHRAIAYARGWLVRTGITPAETPAEVYTPGAITRRLVLLTDAGTYEELTP